MASKLWHPSPRRKWRFPLRLPGLSSLFCGCQRTYAKLARKLPSRCDTDLAIDLREVRLDGLDRHEHRLRNLTVRVTTRDELRDAALGRGQDARRHAPPNPRELTTRLLRPQRRPHSVEDLDRLLERLPCHALLLRTARNPSLDEQRPRELER